MLPIQPNPSPDRVPVSGLVPSSVTRRGFMSQAAGVGASLGMGALFGGSLRQAAAEPTAPLAPNAVAGSLIDLQALGMPYRQDDPVWARDLMWDRKLVLRAATQLNGMSKTQANELLRKFRDGNSIGNEGCQLTCMAMILRMLAPAAQPAWTPRTLNRAAQAALYYTRSGLSMTTLNADLVSEVSSGAVQLGLKEEYLPAVSPWPRMYANTSPLVRAYRSLPPSARTDFLVMLKVGTYDDTVASHYVLLHPNAEESIESADAEILDPAMPAAHEGPWRLTDSADWISGDPEIAAAWVADSIEPTQIGGAWVFTRWNAASGQSLLAPLVTAWAGELARAGN